MQYNLGETILFKKFVLENIEDIKTYMRWDNYQLNETEIPVVEMVKDHALIVLMNSYGLFHVEQDIYDAFCADIFIYFPILLQQLAITRLIDAYGVVANDVETVETVRTETQNSSVAQNSEMVAGTSQTNNNTLNTQQKTTGTVAVEGSASGTQNSTTSIINSSGVESTGTRSVNLAHELPEQAISGSTGEFPIDTQGTPVLTNSYVQTAQEGFTTSNPINTSESSDQSIQNTNSGTNDSTTTNDVTIADTGTTTQITTNSGSDTSESKTDANTTNTYNEKITSHVTNKQYSYEIKAFLETADSLVAFARWEDKFSWVVGII